VSDFLRSKRQAGIVVVVLAAVLCLAVARRNATQAAESLGTDGKILPVSVLLNGQNMNNGCPQLLRDRQGSLWCAWVSARQRDPLAAQNWAKYEEGDMIVLRARRNGQWSEPVTLNTNFGVNFAPVMAEDRDGAIYAVWSSRRHGEDGVWWRRVGPDLRLGNEVRVPPAGRLEGHPAVVTSEDGRVWLALQSWRNGSSDIVFYALERDGWQRLADAAATPDPEYRPRLAAGPGGAVWCAWDVYRAGRYRVMVRRYDPGAGAWGGAEEVPGDGVLDTYAPDLAVEDTGRVWVVYARNEAEETAWGLRGPKPKPGPWPTVRIAVRDRGGWVHPQPVPGQAPG